MVVGIQGNETPCTLLCLVNCAGREGVVMLSYNFTNIYSITNLPCTPSPPRALNFILIATLYPCTSVIMHMHRFITSTHMATAHALHAATRKCAIPPTATAYAPHNPHLKERTRHTMSYIYSCELFTTECSSKSAQRPIL